MTKEEIDILLSFKADVSALRDSQNQLQTVGKTAEGAGVLLRSAFGVSLTFGGLIALGHEIASFATNIVNMANRLELSTDAFQHLSNMARQNGVDMSQLQAGLSKLKASIDGAAEGSPKLAKAFQTLGLDAKVLAEAPLDQALQAIAIQIVNATDKTAALNAANELLGTRSMPKLLEVIKQLGGGYNDTADIIDKEYLERVRQATIATENFFIRLKNLGAVSFADALSIPGQLAGGDASTTIEGRIKETEAAIARYKKTISELNAGNWENPFYAIPAKTTLDNFTTGLATATKHLAELNAEKARGDATLRPKPASDPSDPGEALRIKAEAEAARQLAIKKSEMSAEEETAAQHRALELQKDSISNDVTKLQSQRIREKIALTDREITGEQKLLTAITAKRDAEALGSDERKKLDRELDSQANKLISLQRQQSNDVNAGHAAIDREKASESLAAEIPLRERLADIEKERALITQNHLLDSVTRQQKLNDNAEAYRQIIVQIVAIERQRFATVKDPSEIAQLKAEIARLQTGAREFGRRNDIPTREQQSAANYGELNDPAKHFQDPAGGMRAGLQDFASGMGTVADQIHGHVISIAQGLQSGIGNALLGLETRTMSWGHAFRSVANGLVTSLLTAGNQMVVAWIFSETARTSISAAGATARGGITAGETASHIAHAAIRFTVHAATEIGKTAVTILNAGVRIGTIIAESIAYVAQAAVAALSALAGIPVVGPFLAIGAMAAILAAGYGVVKGISKGFRKGGYTGDGPEDGVAGSVHYGEGVLTAPAMRQPGVMGAMFAINMGDRLSAAAMLADTTTSRLTSRLGSPGGGGLAGAKSAADGARSLGIFVGDDRQNIARQMRGRQGQKAMIETMRNSRGEFFA